MGWGLGRGRGTWGRGTRGRGTRGCETQGRGTRGRGTRGCGDADILLSYIVMRESLKNSKKMLVVIDPFTVRMYLVYDRVEFLYF